MILNEIKIQIIHPIENLKSFEIHPYFVCQSACLPAISSISGGRIGSVLFHNARYQCTTTDLLIWLRFIPCNIVSPAILHCFSSFLINKWKDEKLLKRCRWIVMAYTYYITLIAKCMCTWLHHLLKLLTSTMIIAIIIQIQVSQEGFILRLICLLWFANTAAAEITIKCIQW